MSKLLLGVGYGILAQIFTFIQLQGNIKYDWYKKYPVILLLTSIPIGWFFIKSVENLVLAYGGELWPSRLIGFGIGVIVFTLMSHYLFGEGISAKTIVCLILSLMILLIQILWK